MHSLQHECGWLQIHSAAAPLQEVPGWIRGPARHLRTARTSKGQARMEQMEGRLTVPTRQGAADRSQRDLSGGSRGKRRGGGRRGTRRHEAEGVLATMKVKRVWR